MENRSSAVFARLISLGLLAVAVASVPSVRAEEAGSTGMVDEQQSNWDARLEEAKAMQKKGAALKDEAKQTFETRKNECYRKFRVTACQSEAKQQYVRSTNEARRIENDGLERERQVKKEQLADKDARRIAEEPERQADLREREARKQEETARSEATRASKVAKQEEKLRTGEEQRAAADERLRKKQEKHERIVAEKMEKARRKEAEER